MTAMKPLPGVCHGLDRSRTKSPCWSRADSARPSRSVIPDIWARQNHSLPSTLGDDGSCDSTEEAALRPPLLYLAATTFQRLLALLHHTMLLRSKPREAVLGLIALKLRALCWRATWTGPGSPLVPCRLMVVLYGCVERTLTSFLCIQVGAQASW